MHKNKVGTPNKVKGATTNRKNRVSNTKNFKPKLSAPSKKTSTHNVEQFRENKEDKHKKQLWKAIKAMKSKFTPRYIQMKNRKGTLVPLKKRAEAIADYLENSHWSNPTENGERRNICREKLRKDDTPEKLAESRMQQRADFTVEELNEVIKLGKKQGAWARWNYNGAHQMAWPPK